MHPHTSPRRLLSGSRSPRSASVSTGCLSRQCVDTGRSISICFSVCSCTQSHGRRVAIVACDSSPTLHPEAGRHEAKFCEGLSEIVRSATSCRTQDGLSCLGSCMSGMCSVFLVTSVFLLHNSLSSAHRWCHPFLSLPSLNFYIRVCSLFCTYWIQSAMVYQCQHGLSGI